MILSTLSNETWGTYRDYTNRPILEMTIPSSVDPTLAPEGHHVASFFIQYVPFSPADGEWTEEKKDSFVKKGGLNVPCWSYAQYRQIYEYTTSFPNA